MSRWRPVDKNAIYCIGDIQGNYNLLKKILDRILPLRKSDGGKDKLIFLGDYIDRHSDSHKVLDLCVELKNKYKDQAVFLLGNHELMVLQAFQLGNYKKYLFPDNMFKSWAANGGYDTILGYINRYNLSDCSPYSLSKDRVLDLIPKAHIEFLENLLPYYEQDNYIFVHGGMDPKIPISEQPIETLVWDRELTKSVLYDIAHQKNDFDWDKTIIVGHNKVNSLKPIINKKFMMLDCGSPKQLLVVELNSKEAYMAYPSFERLVKYKLEDTIRPNKVFRRLGAEF